MHVKSFCKKKIIVWEHHVKHLRVQIKKIYIFLSESTMKFQKYISIQYTNKKSINSWENLRLSQNCKPFRSYFII